MRLAGVLLLLGLLYYVCPALAGDGNLEKAPADAWATPLADAEMEDMRGGFSGLAFNVFFTGFFDNLGNTAGNLTVNDGGATTPAPPPNFSVQDGQARISTVIGNFGGANGIFQIAQVPGSFNVVHNNLFVQIAVVNVLAGATAPGLSNLFSLP
jgi:hypothetical protein